eukprot:g416.t1
MNCTGSLLWIFCQRLLEVNFEDSTGLHRTPQNSTGLHRTPQDTTGHHRTPQDTSDRRTRERIPEQKENVARWKTKGKGIVEKQATYLAVKMALGRIRGGACLRSILLAVEDVPQVTKFFHEGLDVDVIHVTENWARLQASELAIELKKEPAPREKASMPLSFLNFDVPNIDEKIPQLLQLGGQLDGAIEYTLRGTIASIEISGGHRIGIFEGKQEE